EPRALAHLGVERQVWRPRRRFDQQPLELLYRTGAFGHLGDDLVVDVKNNPISSRIEPQHGAVEHVACGSLDAILHPGAAVSALTVTALDPATLLAVHEYNDDVAALVVPELRKRVDKLATRWQPHDQAVALLFPIDEGYSASVYFVPRLAYCVDGSAIERAPELYDLRMRLAPRALARFGLGLSERFATFFRGSEPGPCFPAAGVAESEVSSFTRFPRGLWRQAAII